MKEHKTLFYGILTALIFIVFFLGKQCKSPAPEQTNTGALKTKISTQLKQREVQKKEVERRDSIVYKWRDRWHGAKAQIKAAPCDSILPVIVRVADSVIVADSSLILAQARVIILDDSIINNYKAIILNDSIEAVSLHKEIRRQKRQKWLIGVASILIGGAAIVK